MSRLAELSTNSDDVRELLSLVRHAKERLRPLAGQRVTITTHTGGVATGVLTGDYESDPFWPTDRVLITDAKAVWGLSGAVRGDRTWRPCLQAIKTVEHERVEKRTIEL